MTDTTTNPAIENEENAPKALRAKVVKRRMARITSDANPKKVRKKKGKLATAILRQIASGQVKNPRAVAKAFANAASETE